MNVHKYFNNLNKLKLIKIKIYLILLKHFQYSKQKYSYRDVITRTGYRYI